MTTTDSWLALTEYSMKYHVSISTLRRKIKASDIKFRFDDGKYFILDEAPRKNTYAEEPRPSQMSEQQALSASDVSQSAETGESVITAANRLLTDLKKAYTQILQEKEEQISTLKEDIVDLKTLIKVLEYENSRLRDREHQ